LKYYIIAGEASGDLHGSNLLKALKAKDPQAQIRFWGGDQMQAIAGKPVKHIKDLAFMGFVEVVANLRTILSNISFCKKDILEFAPDKLILIDYPGFNLRIADFATKNKIEVHYYISPQIWAWKQNRVHKIKRTVNKMYCILPFEQAFYKKFDMDVHYVGHPLVDAIQNFKETAVSISEFQTEFALNGHPIMALLPGSRLQEIKTKLPIMLEAAKGYQDMEILIGGAPNIPEKFYLDLAKNIPIKVIPNRTYDLLNQAHLAMVTSGTATLETALFKVPQVVCYKGNPISVSIARKLIKVDYISLVNLIMGREVVKELIQKELTAKQINAVLLPMQANDNEARKKLIAEYNELETLLGGGGASDKTASLLVGNT
jgi:lipid-A-disaccharide synthase